MRKLALMTAGAATLVVISCGGNSSPQATTSANSPSGQAAATAKPASPAVPEEMQRAAEATLGSEAEVLLWGDLAKNGHDEVLVVNRMKPNPERPVAGTVVTRAAVIEKDGGAWKEVFHCDEHLKNTKGYLGGTPLAGVAGWRFQYEQDADKGLEMYFTPVDKPAGGYVQTLGVRWNAKMKRYQSLDRNFEQFLAEVPQLDTPQSELRR